MTSGGDSGTNGRPQNAGLNGAAARWLRHPLLWIALTGIVVGLVNATSDIIDARRIGLDDNAGLQFFNEFSSVVVIIALAPCIGWAVDRFPPSAEGWPRTLLIHAALTIPFSLVHVAGIWAVRGGFYALGGADYDFAADGLGLVLIYEYRKDVITYAVIAAAYWAFRVYADRAAAKSAPAPGRIEIRDGASAAFLDPADILWVEAAGNYVQFHTAAREHLVRGTLTAWEAKLTSLGFARIHRARLVNRARIAAVKPTPAGDFELTLDGGAVIGGSRRHRAALDSPQAPAP